MIAFLQVVPEVTTTNGKPAMLPPLSLVLTFQMIKDGYEDYQRHKADLSENKLKTEVFESKYHTFILKDWADIQVGDIVKVTKQNN